MHRYWRTLATASILSAATTGTFAQTQSPTLQQQFNTASEFLDAGKWLDAIAVYEAIENRTPKPGNRILAGARILKAEALVSLGRYSEALSTAQTGLAGLPEAADDKELKHRALMVLGKSAEAQLDYASALASFRNAKAEAPGNLFKLQALAGMIRTGMFYDAREAVTNADEALGMIDPNANGVAASRAQLRTLRARALLNLGEFQQAAAALDLATRELGGLTLKVDTNDVATRSDRAIAAFLSGKAEDGRKFLSYTGAGRLTTDFNPGTEMIPPPCGGLENLTPEDMAIVEFSIAGNGAVSRATPIYSNRQGAPALAFARAVADWSWPVERIKDIPLFFRTLTRVELRCTNKLPRLGTRQMFDVDLANWLDAQDIPEVTIEDASDARRARPLLDELARRESSKGPNSAWVIPVLLQVADNAVTPLPERTAYLVRALSIARTMGAPPEVTAAIGLRLWVYQPDDKDRPPELVQWLQDQKVMSSPRVAAAIGLQTAALSYSKKRVSDAIQQLERIRNDAGLENDDPLRAAALIRLASLRLGQKDVAGAEAAYKESGLSADQCSLLAMGPRIKRRAGESSDYPSEAMLWGFEGWVTVENDIAANGIPTNVRHVIAYPPFLFNTAASRILAARRYDISFTPAGSMACTGQSTPVIFRLPN